MLKQALQCSMDEHDSAGEANVGGNNGALAEDELNSIMDHHAHFCPRNRRMQLCCLSPVSHNPCRLSFSGKSSWRIAIWK